MREVDFLYVLPIADGARQLPTSFGSPIDQRAQDNDAKQQSDEVGIKGNLEQIERERITEGWIAPGRCGAAQVAAAEVAHHGPGIERRERHDDSQQKDAERGEFRVERMLAKPDMGFLQRERMRDPENGESEYRSADCGDHAVGQNAVPGVQLAHFLPPLIVDSPGAQPAQRYEENNGDDGIPKTTAASLAAGNLSMTK